MVENPTVFDIVVLGGGSGGYATALRATDTAVRAQMVPVSIKPDGLIKVAPLLHWSSKDLHEYCVQHGLPNNFDYVDPTKGEDNRECGLHLAH